MAGALHVLSGPDHLAAIAPLASEDATRATPRGSWRTGALWGAGHASGVMVVGVAALLFRSWLPIDAVSAWSERLVGIVLIGIGLWGLRRAFAGRVHTHAHVHGTHADGHTHTHLHAHTHAPGEADTQGDPDARPHRHTHAAFAVGILHGFAGSSHFLAVLPALALPGWAASLSYLGGYGAGTVVAMSGFSLALGWMASFARDTGPQAVRLLLSACSVAALVVGAWWLTL